MINAIIPAAGAGTRLRPHTHSLPKALLPVAGRPILGHILDRLTRLDTLGTVRIVVGFHSELIETFVRSHYACDVEFVHQDGQRGLGDAIHLALSSLPDDDPIVVILGDTILDVDLAAFMAGPDDALGVKEVADPRRFGVVELQADGKTIKRVVEKPADPPSRLAVVGLYGVQNTKLLRRSLAEIVEEGRTTAGEIQMTDALQRMIELGSRMQAVPVEGWFDCGKVETLLETNRYLLEKQVAETTLDGSLVVAPSYVATSAQVSRSIIGPHAAIGENAVVTDSIIRDTIIAEDADVRSCILDQSIIGPGVVVHGEARRLNLGASSEIRVISASV